MRRRRVRPAEKETASPQFLFTDPAGHEIRGAAWLRTWAALYPGGKYDREHDTLIARSGRRVSADFVRIGRWKDSAATPAKWRPNVASVAYVVWMQAAAERPACPNDSGVAAFLRDWSERRYVDTFTNKAVEKRFGLSRATTLLYFLSGGRFPIFDSRVRRAIRLLHGIGIPNTVEGYVTSYVRLFMNIATACRTKDLRRLDRALFAYGVKPSTLQRRPLSAKRSDVRHRG